MKHKQPYITTYKIVFIAVMAAIVYVLTLFRFPLLGSKVHFANAMCLLAGLLFGPVCGGLAAGIAAAVKMLHPDVRVVGVQSTGAPCMKASLDAGHVVALESAKTIADGIAVRRPGDLTFEVQKFCKPYIEQGLARPVLDLSLAVGKKLLAEYEATRT